MTASRVAACLLLIIALPRGAVGQLVSGGAAIGWSLSGADAFAGGPALVLLMDASPLPWLSLRLEAGTVLGSIRYFGIRSNEDPETAEPHWVDLGMVPIVWADAGVVLRTEHVYWLAGFGRYHNDWWSRSNPLAHDLGLHTGTGIAVELAGRRWFAEVTLRAFGNVFYDRSATKVVFPIVVGVRF